ncbi:hypothetical protein ACFXKG_13225 [Streptomyces sp. NPDC059255]|uniref:hypothetical protein n=1 Tax=Streptomyces sp. NPDC059255 TaxID=3346793 RepID=UPI0036CBB494
MRTTPDRTTGPVDPRADGTRADETRADGTQADTPGTPARPGPVTKVAIGLIQIGCAYLFLLVISEATGNAEIPLVLILLFMMAAGSSEVFVGPIGLSLATRMGPEKFRSQMVGLNFLALALGSSLAGLLGQLFTAIDSASYLTVTATCGIGLGLALYAGRRPVGRLLGSGLTH